MTEQTFEELTASVKTLTDELTSLKVLVAKKGEDEDHDDKEMEAFLKAKAEMDEEEKEATEDDEEREAVKKAFKVAQDETDEDKKHEAMKKAQEMKDEHDEAKKARKGKKGQDEDNNNDKEETATKLASLERKYAKPIITKILQAAKQFEPNNIKQIEKTLKTASLSEIEAIWESKKPYIAALGLEGTSESIPQSFIPFQASSITGEPEETDFAKMDSEKLLSEMYR